MQLRRTITRNNVDEVNRLAQAWVQVLVQILQVNRSIADQDVARTKLLADEALTHVLATGTPTEIYNARYGQIYNDILEKRKSLGLDISADTLNQLTYEKLQAPEHQKELAALGSERDLMKEKRDLIRETTAAVSDVKSNPFLLIDEKNELLIPKLQQEAQAHLAAGDAAKSHALQVEALSLTFSGGLQANLTAWVNNFGSAATQVGNLITGVLSTAINGAAQALTGLLFHTKNLGQAAYQVFQSLVQQVIQWGIQMVVTAALGSIIHKQKVAEQVQGNATVLTSATPAAVAQSGATSGSNWIIGAVAAGIAIAAIIALMAGFDQGGYTGTMGTKAIAGVVHGGEYVQPDPAVRYYGLPIMEAMRQRRIPPDAIRALLGDFRVSVPARFGGFETGGEVDMLNSAASAFPRPTSRSHLLYKLRSNSSISLIPAKWRRPS
jgi:hypothetical protein